MSLKVLHGWKYLDDFFFPISYPALRILIQGNKNPHQIPRESVPTYNFIPMLVSLKIAMCVLQSGEVCEWQKGK